MTTITFVTENFIFLSSLAALIALGAVAVRRGYRAHLWWIAPLAATKGVDLARHLFVQILRSQGAAVPIWTIANPFSLTGMILHTFAMVALIVVVARSATRLAPVFQREPLDEGAWPPPPRS
jgi:hypothetical protein